MPDHCRPTITSSPFRPRSTRQPAGFHRDPDACSLVGPALSPGSIVVFESTVYPGVTERFADRPWNIVGPQMRRGLQLGYSPERINPGDKDHPLEKIIKVVAGQDDRQRSSASPPSMARSSMRAFTRRRRSRSRKRPR
jgi:UDP-N-acetyl-D-mannosaminuronate dehydrogenase